MQFVKALPRKRSTTIISSVIIVVVLLLAVSAAGAHGEADQGVMTTGGSNALNCNEGTVGTGSVYQSFTPTVSTLIAVDLLLSVYGSPPDEGISTTIRIRSGSVSGPILETATAFMPSTSANTASPVHFDLEQPLAVTPGELYVIEWLGTGAATWGVTWLLSDPLGNPYAGGNLFNCWGFAHIEQDAFFLTYGTATGGPGDVVPDNPANSGGHSNSRACADNRGRANEHRPENLPPCR